MVETWILYQTTNICNGKIYVGVHKLADHRHSRSYLGSGIALKSSIEKHGKKNFVRVTLAQFCCAEDAYSAEEKMVTEEFIKRKDTYNMKMGGKGCRGRLHTEETKAKIRATNTGQKRSAETRARLSIAAAKRKRKPDSEETKAKRSAKLTGAGTPSSLAVLVDGVYYESIRLAAKLKGISSSTIRYRIQNFKPNFINYRLATETEKLSHAYSKLQ